MARVTAILALAALAASGCGGGTRVSQPSPALPINVTVYIDDSRVSVSPDAVGAGPVALIITNQGTAPRSLTLLPAGASAGQPIASTPAIAPQGTAQLNVELGSGAYSVSTAVNGAPSSGSSIQPATLYIGAARPSASNILLAP